MPTIARFSKPNLWEIAPLANSPQARKRARQSETRRQHNAGLRSSLRTSMKKVNKAILEGDKDAAQAFYKAAAPMIDKMAGKGLIHAHKAARHKSRLNKSVRAM